MLTQIKKVGLANGIKCSGKSYTLSDMVQESYRVSYKAKELGDETLIKLTESHLMSVKKDPTNSKLNGDLEILQKLAASGKKVRKAKIAESTKTKKSSTVSWKSSKKSLSEGLENFKKSAKTKVFYKELEKFSKAIFSGKPITMNEAVSLYKASNSCLTHLTVELEKQPGFIGTYSTCTKLLSRDNGKLLEAIQSNKIPDKDLLSNYVAFTNILLECDSAKNPEEDIEENVNLPEIEDEDVINEEISGVSEEDDRDVINEDDDMTELDDKDVLNEGDDEECEGPECPEDEESLNEASDSEDVPVDLTAEEIRVLKSILSKISTLDETEEEVPGDDEVISDEDDDLVPPDDIDDEDLEEDEDTPVDEEIPLDDEDSEEYAPSEDVVEPSEDEDLEEDEISDKDEEYEEEIPSEDDLEEYDEYEEEVPSGEYEEEVPSEDEDLEEDDDEELEATPEDGIRDRLVKFKGDIDEMLDSLPEKPEDEEDLDVSITESIKNRIKKCF